MRSLSFDLLDSYIEGKDGRIIADFTSMLEKLNICKISSYVVFERFVKIGAVDV